jgi:Type I phosphodiesterase / nucleotide pyrophosphatase
MKLLLALCIAGAVIAAAKVDHVIYISVDGLHSVDVDLYSQLKPNSTIASFFSKGVVYKNASTSMPSDSFPGLMNVFTGSHPRTHGVWYDDSYSRDYFEPGSNCTGKAGGEVSMRQLRVRVCVTSCAASNIFPSLLLSVLLYTARWCSTSPSTQIWMT